MSVHSANRSTTHFLSLIRQQQRGRLKVYLGYAPGVGSTTEMLQEGQRLCRLGVNVVIGIVETNGRAEVKALTKGLEHTPCRQVPFRDLVWQQLDLDAVLARRPTVVLVDELAGLNTPDSRHASRYQDVEEILNAGIHVIATLNLQHLEGPLCSTQQIPVKVKGRVPEHVVRMADQIVSVDPPVDVLRERFVNGRLYPSLQVSEELHRFFALANLAGLRERGQQAVATLVDQRSRQRSDPEGREGRQRLLVCLSSPSLDPAQMVPRCAELADRLDAVWYAVHIQAERPADSAPTGQETIGSALALAKQLGGIPLTLTSSDVVGSITAFVAEYGITHILLGRSRLPWYRRWFGRSVLDRLLQTIGGVDVTVMDST